MVVTRGQINGSCLGMNENKIEKIMDLEFIRSD